MQLISHEPGGSWQTDDLRIHRWYRQREEIAEQIQKTRLLLTTPAAEAQPLSGSLGKLCQLLIDYVSVGHFVIYVQLIRPSVAVSSSTLLRLYHTIETTTDTVLDFNACCEAPVCAATELRYRIEELGIQLRTRFALEDTLVNLMEASSSRTPRQALWR